MSAAEEMLKQMPKELRAAFMFYRIWGLRHQLEPRFLKRNLSYMRQQLRRPKRIRWKKEINMAVCKIVSDKIERELKDQNFITVTCVAFIDHSREPLPLRNMTVEVLIARKLYISGDGGPTSSVEKSLGTYIVPINPRDNDTRMVPCVAIPLANINLAKGPVKSWSILIRSVEVGSCFQGNFMITNEQGKCLLDEVEGPIWSLVIGHPKNGTVSTFRPVPKFSVKFELSNTGNTGYVTKPYGNKTRAAVRATSNAFQWQTSNADDRPARKPVGRPRKIKPSDEIGKITSTVRSISYSYSYDNYQTSPLEAYANKSMCPFCAMNCPTTYGLLKHITLCHTRYRFTFQVVLHYQIQLGNIPIPKSVRQARILENFQIFDFELSAADLKVLDGFDRNGRVCFGNRLPDHPHYPFNIP